MNVVNQNFTSIFNSAVHSHVLIFDGRAANCVSVCIKL